MKLLGFLLTTLFSIFAIANIQPAKVLKVTTDNLSPVATYKITVKLPCWVPEVGKIKEIQSNTLVIGAVIEYPAIDEAQACDAEPAERVIEFKVENINAIKNIIVLGRTDGIKTVTKKNKNSNKAIYDALDIKAVVLPPQPELPEVSVTRLQKQVSGLTCVKTTSTHEDYFGGYGWKETDYDCQLDSMYKANQIYRAMDVAVDTYHGRDGYIDTKIAGQLSCTLEVIEEGISGPSNYSTFLCELKN